MAIHYQHELDRTFHALGDGTRREMLSMLARRGELTASELGAPFSLSQPSASKHIRVLERAGLLRRRVEGRLHRFQLATGALREAEGWLDRHLAFWEATLDRLVEVLGEAEETP